MQCLFGASVSVYKALNVARLYAFGYRKYIAQACVIYSNDGKCVHAYNEYMYRAYSGMCHTNTNMGYIRREEVFNARIYCLMHTDDIHRLPFPLHSQHFHARNPAFIS
jgi:hypothetical protein